MVKLPKRVKVAGFWMDVLYPYNFMDTDYQGFYDGIACHLKVTARSKEDGRVIPDKEILSTLLHEIFHAIDYCYCNGRIMETDEDDIDRLAVGFSQVMFDNDLKLREGKLVFPKSIRILGYDIKIVYPYTYTENGLQSTFSSSHNEIKVGVTKQSNNVSDQYMRFIFLYNIVCAVCEYAKVKERGDKNFIQALATGIYQVIMDNSLDVLFREVGKKKMSKSWYEMTPGEREVYVNQDYVPRRYILVNTDTFDSEQYHLRNIYTDIKLDEYGLEDLLGFITNRQKEVIVSIYLNGKTQMKTGEILGISRSSVQTHLRRAKRKLRKYVGKVISPKQLTLDLGGEI